MKLTNANIQKLPLPAKGTETVWCSAVPGLGVRLNAGGKRSFICRVGSRKRTLGSAKVMSLQQAREAATKLQAHHTLHRVGQAPQQTLQSALADYVGTVIASKSSRYQSAWAHLRRFIPQEVLSKKLDMVTRQDLLAVIRQFEDRPGTQDMAVKQFKAFFNHCLNEELATRNPLTGYKRKERCQPRTTVLTTDEVKRLWNLPDSNQMARALKLLLLTGGRAKEILELEQAEVNADGFTVAAHRTKTRKAWSVVLPPAALSLLRGWQFGPIDIHKTRRYMRAQVGTERGLHDIRRTMASRLLALDVAPHVVSLCLNHVPQGFGGVERAYFHETFTAQRAEALRIWHGYLQSL